MNALEVRGLSKSFGGIRAVDNVGFSLKPGELLALIGPNGAGKTTCFNMLNGQTRPDTGSVKVFGQEVVGLPPFKVWKFGVGRTFQITATFGSMTVAENVQLALMNYHRELMRVTVAAPSLYRAEAEALLARVGIGNQADRRCNVLAYGDLKRVELAVALANSPRLLLMDEPTAGMAPRERLDLMSLTREIVAERGISVLFTEHDMDVVFGKADRILVLDRGCLIADASPAEIRSDERVRAIYLGSAADSRRRPAPALYASPALHA